VFWVEKRSLKGLSKKVLKSVLGCLFFFQNFSAFFGCSLGELLETFSSQNFSVFFGDAFRNF